MNEHSNNADAKVIRCADIEELSFLYACDELDADRRAAVDSHVAQCSACAAVLSRERNLHGAIASLHQPADSLDRSGLLLAQCRSQLAEALDDHEAQTKQPGWVAIFSPVTWWNGLRHTLIYHPAMSMAVLVVAGFLAGVAGQRLPIASSPISARAVMTVSPTSKVSTPKVTDQQLQSAASANVAWVTPSGSRTPTVQVDLMSQTPTSIVGSPEDADVERALTFVIENGERFEPGARLDSLDVLRTQAADPEVRRVLCSAARTDRNPGVRMKALDALQGFENDPAVRRTLLDLLQSDDNSGVRVSAIDLLVNSLRTDGGSSAPDARTLSVLRDRLRNDPNNYVRMQSAAALHELGSSELP